MLCPGCGSTRIRSGQAQSDDFTLCKLILRVYINLAASTPITPPHVTYRYHSHILSNSLLPSLVALGRLFVITISDQPDPDDHTLVFDIVTLCHALSPPLVVGSEHSELISLVIDASKRQDERLQQLSLSTLCQWARRSPRVLPFLSSRLHSSFPSLQLTALDVWLRLTSDCEDGEVLEAALVAVPLLVSLAASKRTDVADRAVAVLVNVVAHKEAREQMWRAKGFVQGIRLQLTGQQSPVALVRLLRCLSLSPGLAESIWKEGLIDDVLHLLHSAQQRTEQQRQQAEEKAQIERDVEKQQQAAHLRVDNELQSGSYRYLRNLVSVRVETDGTDDDPSNERWESRQWTILQSSVSDSVFTTQRGIARHIIASPSFERTLCTVPLTPLMPDAARLLAALIVSVGHQGQSEAAAQKCGAQAATDIDTRLTAPSPPVLLLLACLAHSNSFEDQYAAASAYRCLVEAQTPPSEEAVCEMRRCLLVELQHSGSAHVVNTVAAGLMAMMRQNSMWQWQSVERQLLTEAAERWAARMQRQQAEEDVDDPSDEFTMVCQLPQTLLQLLSDTCIHNSAPLSAEEISTASISADR